MRLKYLSGLKSCQERTPAPLLFRRYSLWLTASQQLHARRYCSQTTRDFLRKNWPSGSAFRSRAQNLGYSERVSASSSSSSNAAISSLIALDASSIISPAVAAVPPPVNLAAQARHAAPNALTRDLVA